MSDYIDTREGWTEIPNGDGTRSNALVLHDERGTGIRRWVREAPVPPLPTAPYTVIRVTPPAAYAAGIPMLYVHDGTRYAMVSLNSWLSLENAEDAADFGVEVLSEPRAVTAKAVIDRAIELAIIVRRDVADTIRAEFGVES